MGFVCTTALLPKFSAIGFGGRQDSLPRVSTAKILQDKMEHKIEATYIHI